MVHLATWIRTSEYPAISFGATGLATALDEQIRRRRENLSANQRELIEQHLLADVGSHLGERVHAAWSHIRRMNDQLAEHPTGSGVTLQLRWEANPEAGPGAVEVCAMSICSTRLSERRWAPSWRSGSERRATTPWTCICQALDVERLLATVPIGRSRLSASLVGDSHALDSTEPVGRLVIAALAHLAGLKAGGLSSAD